MARRSKASTLALPFRVAAFFVLLLGLGTRTAFPDSFSVSYALPGVETPNGITPYYETFNGQTAGSRPSSSFVTTFGGSQFTGTYTGNLLWSAADEYGGAGGSGVYPDLYYSGSYSLRINPSANYFGLWFSALDPNNELRFYSGSTLQYTFNPAEFISLVGACPGSSVCGNPNASFLGRDNTEQFAYLNFYDRTGTFDSVVFTQLTGKAGFESDNHAVALITASPGGTPIPSSPEPATISLIVFAGLSLPFWWRNRKNYRES